VTLAAGALAALLTRHAAAAAPPALVGSTIKAATLSAAGHAAAGAVSARVAALTEGVLKAMLLSKLKTLTAVMLAMAALGAAVVWLAHPAQADSPAKKQADAAQQGKKGGKTTQADVVLGTIRSVDAGRNTVTVTVPIPGTKDREEKTFELVKDAKILLDNTTAKGQEPQKGTLDDLTEDTLVTLFLGEDKQKATGLVARGPTVQGVIQSTDDVSNSIIMTKKTKPAEDVTLQLAPGAKILFAGANKKDPPKEGKLADLTEGTHVSVQLTVDRQKALGVLIVGKAVIGQVKRFDATNRTITVTLGKDGTGAEKSFSLAPDAWIESKSGDFPAGTPVILQLSAADPQTVVAVRRNAKATQEE
jgi:hypothetical protein